MPAYTSADHLYNCFRVLFARIEKENPQAAEAVLKSRLLICLRCTEPTAEIMIDARQRPLQITYGSSLLKPDLDVALTADTLHRILSGELTLVKALGSGLLKPTGPVWKTAVLADLFYQAQRIYPQIFQQQS